MDPHITNPGRVVDVLWTRCFAVASEKAGGICTALALLVPEFDVKQIASVLRLSDVPYVRNLLASAVFCICL